MFAKITPHFSNEVTLDSQRATATPNTNPHRNGERQKKKRIQSKCNYDSVDLSNKNSVLNNISNTLFSGVV
ncbi:hypothetical protein KUL106_00150 [Alteromonas sp. KUL106]|nr:hypothetical protein KUL106_00150 [Alteromonas sp. KUL106]